MKVYLKRISDDHKQTTGLLSVGEREFSALELPFLGNQHDISCIPPGTYPCKWTRSNRLSASLGHDVYTFEVLSVPDRAGIRIHSANFAYQLKGCIALGLAFEDIDGNGEIDVIHSKDAIAQFNELLNKEDFELIITNTWLST